MTTVISNQYVRGLLGARRLRLVEILPWVSAVLGYLLLPEYLSLGSQILIMVLFALSLDLILGYSGVVVLGHAAFYGTGAYAAGLLALSGWQNPLLGLATSAVVAAVLGLFVGIVILRTSGLALLMLGLVVALALQELANRMRWLTGGFDGLQGITVKPLLGRFEFDYTGHTGYLYSLAVLFMVWALIRLLVLAPFGRSLIGIRENPVRMEAIGTPVLRRKLIAFSISAGIAGLAGALYAQTNQFVSISVLSFDLSGAVLIMLAFGGAGRLYGAFIGAPLYMIAQDMLAKGDPVYWLFWLGLVLIGTVLFARGGVLGIIDRIERRLLRPATVDAEGTPGGH